MGQRKALKLRYTEVFAGVLVFFHLATASAVCAAGDSAGTRLAAKVNGTPITEKQLEIAVDEYVPRSLYHGNITPEKRAVFRPKALEEMIKKELYIQEAGKIGLTIKKQDLKAALRTVKDRFNSERDFQKALKANDLTQEGFEKILENNLLVNMFIDEEITKKAQVTEEYLKDYYEKNKKSYVMPDAFRIRHILIKVPATAEKEEREKLRKDAEDVLAKAKSGEDFGDLAYKYSMDDWRVKGGDLGLVHKGRIDPDLEKAALGLEAGQISDIIETVYGYHFLKLEEKVPGKQLSFDEIRDKLRKQAEGARRNEIEEGILKRLKENATIEIY